MRVMGIGTPIREGGSRGFERARDVRWTDYGTVVVVNAAEEERDI